MMTEAESLEAGIQGRAIWWEGLSCFDGVGWRRRRVWPWSRNGGVGEVDSWSGDMGLVMEGGFWVGLVVVS
ncbi:MAG: hypothetical protein RI897_3410 [Verrucomicrobiota bacterium]